MRTKTCSSWLVAAVIGSLLGYPPLSLGAAQRRLPTEKGENSPSVWTNKVTIWRPIPPGQPRSRRRVIRAPLLTLEWKIFKQAQDETPEEASPNTVFYTGDRVQIRIKPNQDGYLHILSSVEGKDEDGNQVFPNSQINGGKNFVRKNEEIIIPSNCEPPRDTNCWLIMEPPSGREILTVIFSREAAPKAMSQIKVVGERVSQEDIGKLKESARLRNSPPKHGPKRGGDAGRYAIWVTNTDNKNNEELIAKIVVNHEERSNEK